MSKIDELAVEQAMMKEDAIPDELQPKMQEVEQESPGGFRLDLSWFKTETGEGEIDEYIDHPLNFNNSKGIAQALRGFAGFMGNGSQLRFAIIDILFGLNRFRKDLKPNG